jgi:hypothetical protein
MWQASAAALLLSLTSSKEGHVTDSKAENGSDDIKALPFILLRVSIFSPAFKRFAISRLALSPMPKTSRSAPESTRTERRTALSQ